jgi:hypothetical protein
MLFLIFSHKYKLLSLFFYYGCNRAIFCYSYIVGGATVAGRTHLTIMALEK